VLSEWAKFLHHVARHPPTRGGQGPQPLASRDLPDPHWPDWAAAPEGWQRGGTWGYTHGGGATDAAPTRIGVCLINTRGYARSSCEEECCGLGQGREWCMP
jgi:hypothetical protein